jgi:hypothetical protein
MSEIKEKYYICKILGTGYCSLLGLQLPIYHSITISENVINLLKNSGYLVEVLESYGELKKEEPEKNLDTKTTIIEEKEQNNIDKSIKKNKNNIEKIIQEEQNVEEEVATEEQNVEEEVATEEQNVEEEVATEEQNVEEEVATEEQNVEEENIFKKIPSNVLENYSLEKLKKYAQEINNYYFSENLEEGIDLNLTKKNLLKVILKINEQI